MPKKANLDDAQHKKYYDALMSVRAKITKQIQYHVEDALDSTNSGHRGTSTHMADVGTDNSRHEMGLKMLSEESGDLQLVDEALKRLADGEYGICQECNEEISEQRLAVRPYAVYCVKCKSKLEKQGLDVNGY